MRVLRINPYIIVCLINILLIRRHTVYLFLVDASSVSEIEQCQDDETCTKSNEEVFDVFGKFINDAKIKLLEGQKFLDEHVFRQKEVVAGTSANGKNYIDIQPAMEQEASDTNALFDGMVKVFNNLMATGEPTEGALESILKQSQSISSTNGIKRNGVDVVNLFKESFAQAMVSFDKHFGHIELKENLPISLMYFIEKEDGVKTPSWKRRQHRYLRDVDVKTVKILHNALYLAHLSYVTKVDEIRRGIESFIEPLELIYADEEGLPHEPAHFIAVKKESGNSNKFPFPGQTTLEVVMVIRGTKEIGDMLTDVIMDVEDYRGGKAHSGIVKAGKYLVEKHIKLMDTLLELSGRQKIKLNLFGHSLGAGAAAIAAIEFNSEYEHIDANAIGFGCPALLSKELAESTKDYITTVIADSDVVPRMSGAAVSNMILDILSYDWTARAMEDIDQFLDVMRSSLPFDIPKDTILNQFNSFFDKHDRPYFDKVLADRVDPVLIPPGNCLHIYRDGFGFSGKHTPCAFFNSVDVTRTMIDDHLTDSGYHRAFLHFVRDRIDDLHFDFHHDLLSVPV